MVSVMDLWLPTLLSGVALFFASFLSWMVLQLHKTDWVKMPHEDNVIQALRAAGVQPGNYMIPGVSDPKEMGSAEFQQKMKAGPNGVLTLFPGMTMGRNLALTMLYFLVVSFCIGYLATLGVQPGAEFMKVFRFVSTAGLLTFLSAIVQHSIWFRCRITGHVIESIAYAGIIGGIFGALWP